MDAVVGALRHGLQWKVGLPLIKWLYSVGVSVRYYMHREENEMTLKVAGQISADIDNYPLPLVAIADSQLRSVAGAAASKLLDIASAEGWFRE